MRVHSSTLVAAFAVLVAMIASPASIGQASTDSSDRLGNAKCGKLRGTIRGTSGADRLIGTAKRDVILGLGGNDYIDGGGGNDKVCGDSGADLIRGGRGKDNVLGGPGKDFVAGEAGHDRLDGGPGSDTCSQNAGRGTVSRCEIIIDRARTVPRNAPIRTDAQAAALVRRRDWEPRPENAAANQTVPSGEVPWSTASAQTYWRRWIAKRTRVTGSFTGTTDEIFQWTAHKWGIDEDLVRAMALKESYWRQAFVGDRGASFGVMQIRNVSSNGSAAFGGYPWTQRSTALNVDFYGAWIRACLEGDFYDGGRWLYGGKRVTGDLWGCVGAWYSGAWYDAGSVRYVAAVKVILAARQWRAWRG